MNDIAAARALYQRDAVLSASPARLLTMLYDRLLLDLQRAEAEQVAGAWDAAEQHLLHAQEIVGQLSDSLKPELWDGGPGLAALYAFVAKALIGANAYKDVNRTRECIQLLEPLRKAWHEAAASVAAPESVFGAAGQALA